MHSAFGAVSAATAGCSGGDRGLRRSRAKEVTIPPVESSARNAQQERVPTASATGSWCQPIASRSSFANSRKARGRGPPRTWSTFALQRIMSASRQIVRRGGSAVCIALSVACSTEFAAWLARALLFRKRRTGRSPRPSYQRAATSALAGLVPLAMYMATGCEARASATAVLLSAIMHVRGSPFERVAGVVCSRAASRGDARSCVTMCLLACLGDLRLRNSCAHALVVVGGVGAWLSGS